MISRSEFKGNYTQIHNEIFNNPDLSAKSKGILAQLFVITSYSIHYTKLYDLSAPVMERAAEGPVLDLIMPLRQMSA